MFAAAFGVVTRFDAVLVTGFAIVFAVVFAVVVAVVFAAVVAVVLELVAIGVPMTAPDAAAATKTTATPFSCFFTKSSTCSDGARPTSNPLS